MKGHSIVAIDAGYRNFAVCEIVNGDWKEPAHWVNAPLFDGPFSEPVLFEAIYTWCTDNSWLLSNADIIVLERQMKKKFAVINTVIRTLHYAKTVEVNPISVGAFFGLPKDRAAKKKAAVELAEKNTRFPGGATRKKDDLADAYLMAVHRVFVTQFAFRKGWNELLQPTVAGRGPRGLEEGSRQQAAHVNGRGYDIDLVSESSGSQ